MIDTSFFQSLETGDTPIGVVGLGYVGLPLAVALAEKFRVIGYDVSEPRVELLRENRDPSDELREDELAAVTIDYTSDASKLAAAKLIIVAVPTPIDENNNPDLSPLESASAAIGAHLTEGSIVVFDRRSILASPRTFAARRSRKHPDSAWARTFSWAIPPSASTRAIANVPSTRSSRSSRQTPEVAVDRRGCVRGDRDSRNPPGELHPGGEAAKVIENAHTGYQYCVRQRARHHLRQMGIDTREVARSGRNEVELLEFRPGLVGGHCIGVDPYYLTFKAQTLGHSRKRFCRDAASMTAWAAGSGGGSSRC